MQISFKFRGLTVLNTKNVYLDITSLV